MELYHNKEELYHKVQKTLTEMFRVRSYTDTIQQDISDFNTPCPIVSCNEATAYISFVKLGKDKIMKFIKQLEVDNINHTILITMDELTTQAKKIISDNGTVEVFLISNVMYNILDHVLQPKFRIISPTETKNLLEMLQCSLVELPKLSINDPVSKFFNAKPRDVFKITRRENIYYRVVV